MTLEDLQPRCAVRGIHPDGVVTVVSVQWFGSEALELTYKTASGTVANELLYRHDEARLEIVGQGRPWSFDGDGALFRLVSEAQRIRLAHLFDPVLAVHTSVVEPLPHQITAVYEAMLPRQPLRFLLADDPGAGKTIMAGLLIKELVARGDLERCLIVCPGSLAEQWQDELYRRFQLPFEILTNDKLEAARTGNWFLETNLVIARLDKLSRNEDVQQKLQAPEADWDLVVCDEAHKLSATFFGGEIKYTKRYRLAQLLSGLTRHLLLMTATPHNGKEEDFQLFLALLDGDRFEGRFRDGVHAADVSDLMRRMVKERLLKFDGKPLFPERIAYTVPYALSDEEARLYAAVTDYVREEFNRADALANAKRAGAVGFALTILQRRLASSPEAIYQSLRRRRERLESRLRELEVLQRGGESAAGVTLATPMLDPDEVEDLDDAPEQEVEDAEAHVLDQATAARSITELKAEIETLTKLERLALGVRRGGGDTKWRELAGLFSDIFTTAGLRRRLRETPHGAGEIPPHRASPRQKLVLFTEHRDTLRYLHERITTLLGREESVVVIHGGVGREERLAVQEAFRHDPQVQVLLATDAAGEGINLQRAHLMVNYDLPWNPNRLGAALRPHPPDRPDRGLPSVEPGRGRHARGRRLPAPPGEAGTGPAGPRRAGVRRARKAGVRTRDPGREPHPHGRSARHLEAGALRRARRRRQAAPPALRALSRLPPVGGGRTWNAVGALLERSECAWIDRDLERKAQAYAVAHVVPEHLREVRAARLTLIAKTEAAVKDRLTKEIAFWDHRAEQLKLDEAAGRTGARLNSGEARRRADDLQLRLQKRLAQLQRDAQISPRPPVVLGGVLVVPRGLIDTMAGRPAPSTAVTHDTQEVAARARAIVMETERGLGFEPTDRELEKLGYDVESRVPATGTLRFIEVKGRRSDAETVTVTRNEILYSLNKPDDLSWRSSSSATTRRTASTTCGSRSSGSPISTPRASTTR